MPLLLCICPHQQLCMGTNAKFGHCDLTALQPSDAFMVCIFQAGHVDLDKFRLDPSDMTKLQLDPIWSRCLQVSYSRNM